MRDVRKTGSQRSGRGAFLTIFAIAGTALIAVTIRSPQRPVADMAAKQVRIARAYGELPLSFEPNVGQARKDIDYLARGAGFSIYLSPAAATLALAQKSPSSRTQTVRIHLEGANREASAAAGGRQPGVSNYFVGSNPANWRRGIPTFADVKYRSAYPGIDVAYHGQTGRVEFDFDVAAGADPSPIVIGIDGAGGVRVNDEGDALIRVGRNSIALHKPNAWQTRDGLRRPVDVAYRAVGQNKSPLQSAITITATR